LFQETRKHKKRKRKRELKKQKSKNRNKTEERYGEREENRKYETRAIEEHNRGRIANERRTF